MTNRKSMADEFILSDEGMIEVARNFTGALERRLKGEESSLALLDSCLSLPTGQETGTYLALDFGGTNVRAFRIRPQGIYLTRVERTRDEVRPKERIRHG